MCLRIFVVMLFLIMLLIVGCEPSVKDGQTYEEYVQMARTYKKDGDYDRAIAAGKKAVSIKPTDGEAHYILATAYQDAYDKSFDAAQRKRIAALVQNPGRQQKEDWVEEYKKYGLKPELKNLAIQEFKEVVKYSPNNWFARYMIATDYLNNKHFREAIDEYKKVIAIKPNYANSYSLMGKAYYRLGEYNSAIQPLQTAIKLDPSSVEDYLTLGLAYRKAKKWTKYVEIAEKLKGMDAGRYNQLVNPLN